MAPKLLIIADDLTGALEAGEKLADARVPVLVVDNTRVNLHMKPARDYEVIVINSESRHVSIQTAAKKIRIIVGQAKAAGIKLFYKKTDSTLRGNIGSELTALMKATGSKSIMYLPAHPEQKRFTINGYQYLGKELLHKTKFGNDPLEPVKQSFVPKVLGIQTHETIYSFNIKELKDQAFITRKNGIIVFNSASLIDFEKIKNHLKGYRDFTILAGTAGFVRMLPELLQLKKGIIKKAIAIGPALIINGSLNPVSIKQVSYARSKGLQTISISEILTFANGQPVRKIPASFLKSIINNFERGSDVILSTSGIDIMKNTSGRLKKLPPQKKSRTIPRQIGKLVREILDRRKVNILVVFGGDTLTGIIRSLQCATIIPTGKVIPGITASIIPFRNKPLILITKPGGYGNDNSIIKVLKTIRG